MLPKQKRIQKKNFPSLSGKGRSFFADQITLRIIPQQEKTFSKASIVVSKKVLKTAVGRNRIRRRVYATLEEFLPNIQSGFFLIFYPKAPIEKISSKELRNQIFTTLTSAQLISPRNN